MPATAEQLRAIRKKAGIGEFKRAKAPPSDSKALPPSPPKRKRRKAPSVNWTANRFR